MDRKNTERYRRLKGIVGAALKHAREVRHVFIAGIGDDNEALPPEATGSPAADTPADKTQSAPNQATEEVRLQAPLPRNYRLVRHLGDGGMGMVYLAERIDGDLRQPVALKLLHLTGMIDASLACRFAAERRILSALSHPNIAHLLDGGLTAEGRPFLAMEYVDGERIDLWCERHGLPLRARIQLFLKVCAAVDYAHRHMVIHCDIKPANILVTHAGNQLRPAGRKQRSGAGRPLVTCGEPKLLDFGIARLLENGTDTTLTETGQYALTMAYASPEQVEGRALSAATDVYSLGVVLYQLLTGTRPFDHLPDPHALPEAIVASEITPPSKMTQPHGRAPLDPPVVIDRSRPRIPHDMDAIVLKALRRDPAQRYASVKAFAEDLERFLSSRPVLARRRHWLYLGRRFAWRHRWGVIAAAALTILLGTFTLDREAQLKEAAREYERAEAVTAFFNDLFANTESLSPRGTDVTVREMLDQGARDLLPRQFPDPDIKSHILLAMGRAYNALYLGEEARALLEIALALVESSGPTLIHAGTLAELSQAYSLVRDPANAVAAASSALEILRTLSDTDPAVITDLELRRLHSHLNLLDVPLSDITDELNLMLERLEADSATTSPELLLRTYYTLTTAYIYRGLAEEALATAEQAMTLGSRLYPAQDPRSMRYRLAYATAMSNSDPEKSVPIYEALISDLAERIGSGLILANIYNALGLALSESGQLADSLVAHQMAASMLEEGGARSHWRRVSHDLARSYLLNGHPHKAAAVAHEILSDFTTSSDANPGTLDIDHARSLSILADALLELGELGKAEQHYAESEQLLRSFDAGAWPSYRRGVLEKLAAVRLQLERYPQARETLDSLDMILRINDHPPGHPSAVRAATLRIRLFNATGHHQAAAELAASTHANACNVSQVSDTALDALRAAWTDAHRAMVGGDLQPPPSACQATVVAEASAE